MKEYLGVKPKRSWNEAVIRWLKESTHKATIESDKSHLRWLDRHLRGRDLELISRSLTDRLIEARLRQLELWSIRVSAMAATPLSGTMAECKPRVPQKCALDAEWGRVSFTYKRRAVAIVGVPATKRMSFATTIN